MVGHTLACSRDGYSRCGHHLRATGTPLSVLAAGTDGNIHVDLLGVHESFLFEPASHFVGKCCSWSGTSSCEPGPNGGYQVVQGGTTADGGLDVLLAKLNPAAGFDLVMFISPRYGFDAVTSNLLAGKGIPLFDVA